MKMNHVVPWSVGLGLLALTACSPESTPHLPATPITIATPTPLAVPPLLTSPAATPTEHAPTATAMAETATPVPTETEFVDEVATWKKRGVHFVDVSPQHNAFQAGSNLMETSSLGALEASTRPSREGSNTSEQVRMILFGGNRAYAIPVVGEPYYINAAHNTQGQLTDIFTLYWVTDEEGNGSFYYLHELLRALVIAPDYATAYQYAQQEGLIDPQ